MQGGNARYEIAEGLRVNLGSLDFSRPWFPSVTERAELVKGHLPGWAIASGSTAGWVWTGMGYPVPWTVLRKPAPALSPMTRTTWSARLVREGIHHVVEMNGLLLLDRRSAAIEVLYADAHIDASAAQILFLVDRSRVHTMTGETSGRRTPRERTRAQRVVERLATLATLYPDITR